MLHILTLVAAAGWCQQVPAAKPFTPAEIQAAKRDPRQFTVTADSARIEMQGAAMAPMAVPEPGGGSFDPSDAMVYVDQVINIGRKIWKIVEDNKPVVDIKTQYATAVPEGITNWAQLSGWDTPEGTVYGFYAKNAYGMKVVEIKYQVVRTSGGSYKGKGRYLTGVTIEPLMVSVAWGYHVTLTAEVPTVTNADKTGNDPMAAMMLNCKWRIQTPIKDIQQEGVYYVRGDGFFKEVGGPFDNKQIANAETRVEALSKADLW